MYEPITVVKVREARTVTVPAGGWIVLSTPDEPLSKHIEKRAKLIKDGHVNDEYATLLIGRLQDTHPITRFVTKKQAETAALEQKNQQDAISQNIADAKTRQAKQGEDREKKLAAEHQARVAELNAENDAIRNRDANVPAVVEVAETRELPPVPTPAEKRRDELLALKRDELLALIEGLKAAGKAVGEVKGTKSSLVAAILTAEGITIEVKETE